MTREEKAATVAALHERFAKARVALIASNFGLSVQQSTSLRRLLKAVGGEYKVAKHTLVRRALDQTAYGAIESLLEGPRGLVFGYDDPVAAAKALVAFAEQNDKLHIDGGVVEGQALSAERVKSLAMMPDLSVLRARVACQARAPGSRIVAAATGQARRIAGAVAALVGKLEDAPSDA